MWQAGFAVLLVLALSACGFQLRGAGLALPEEMARTYIDTPDRFSDLYRSLQRQLLANGVDVVGRRDEAGAVLRIREDESGERVVSVSARNIPREFEVHYLVDFDLQFDDTVRLAEQRIVQTRTYTWLETEVLGKEEEARRVRRALADDLALRMLQRVGSLNAGT